ncbi:hypothetical protein R1flu_006998 [Riccia fluitans]|uniref:Uncharacterized protein n=1 Tax=Riccia fluitans TaxID=41844 RepID=A0ABD1YYQ1_9MARC
MEDLKAMARAKRASSKRGRARHSHHKQQPHAPAPGADSGSAPAFDGGAAREENAQEKALPSNWERYSDDGGSEDGEAADGEVYPKSKGADYSQLLSSDAPKLHEDLPEPDGMFSLMLGSGLELWDGDSWLEAPSASEQQAAHDAAALLTPDLEVLGRSLSRLHVAERLMVEKELFPEQVSEMTVKEDVGTSSRLETSTIFRAERSLREEKQDTIAKAYGSEEIRENELPASPPVVNGGVNLTYQLGIQSTVALSSATNSPVKSMESVSCLKTDASVSRYNTVEQAARPDERVTRETSAQPPGYRKFVPAAAEADLDELLDMLDSVGQPPATSSGLRSEAESTSDLSFLSNFPKESPPRTDTFSRITSRKSGGGNHVLMPSVANKGRSEESKVVPSTGHWKEVKTSGAVSFDDDFDSWIDSI